MGAIEVNGLRKAFPNGVEAVAGIDLTVEQGEIFGFLGPNGAGKSTTTRMLTTLLRPTSGTARVAGLDILKQSAQVRRIIGVALQDAGLDYLATGRELLEVQGRLHGLHGRLVRDRADKMLTLVGLKDAAERRVGTYSGGMRRRLDLASALVHDPEILFLDEPTAGLDPASRQAIWDEVVHMNQKRGITVFLTTQYLEEADRLTDRIAIIDHGRIVAEGSPEELKASIGADVVTVGVPDDQIARAEKALSKLEGLKEIQTDAKGLTLFLHDGSEAVARVIRLLDKAKVSVGSITVSSPTLDEVFLRLTGSRLEGSTEEVAS
ncbi:MAG TPA: ATP-binding cassette domain-containing protein [Actinomycetota bacterium]|nr:ATP-binding cassette domain-containing protein [Actinomycetota bacterium]